MEEALQRQGGAPTLPRLLPMRCMTITLNRGLGRGIGTALFAITVIVLTPAASAWEIDATDVVDRVIDGDTFDTVSLGRVRLADIDTPEVGEPGADKATDFLADLVLYEEVHLDIDDVDETDRYGRWIAVVYVRHNASHLLNVNEALLEAGLADMWDFPNEFDPSTWPLYVYHPTETTPPPEEPPTDEPPPDDPMEPGGPQPAREIPNVWIGVAMSTVIVAILVALWWWRRA